MRLVRAAGLTMTVLALAGAAAPPGIVGSGAVAVAFRMSDPRITESSGLAISRSRPGLAYTVNDSGDGPYVYAIDMGTGAVVGVTALAGVEAVDFEAMGTGPDATLLVADIGDNDADRDVVRVHVIDEPRRGSVAVEPRSVELTYPDGPHDAEAVLTVGDRLVVVTKEFVGAGFYAAPVFTEDSGTAFVLRRVGDAPAVVTDATVLDDGRVVVRDYGRGYVVRPDGWRQVGRFRLPRMPQGETIAAADIGQVVYAGSEGTDSAVYRLRVPGPGADGETGRRPGERSTAASGHTDVPAATPPSTPPSTGSGTAQLAPWLMAGGVLALIAAAAAVRRRRW